MSSGVNIIRATQLSDTGYTTDLTDYDLCSSQARLVVSTSAKSVWIKAWVTSDLYGTYPTQCEIGVWVNGSPYAVCQATGNGINTWSVDLPAGNKTVEIVSGGQNKPLVVVLGTFIKAIYFCGADYSMSVVSPTNRMLIYGDSIASGFLAGSPNSESWPMLLRASRGNVMVEAWGYRALYHDCIDAAARAAFVTRIQGYSPSEMIITVGTNDYGTSLWSAANFGAAYADLLDRLHTILPSLSIYALTPLFRDIETANGEGNTLDDYRAQIATAQSTRSAWCTLINGKSILVSGDLADGIHPSTGGHAKVYAAILAAL